MRCFMLLWGRTDVLKTMQSLDNKIHLPLGMHHSDPLKSRIRYKGSYVPQNNVWVLDWLVLWQCSLLVASVTFANSCNFSAPNDHSVMASRAQTAVLPFACGECENQGANLYPHISRKTVSPLSYPLGHRCLWKDILTLSISPVFYQSINRIFLSK